ncbi:MAG: pirin family protein [Haliangiales bacterium]
MSEQAVLQVGPLGFPWPTIDPFLFCVHHDDAYPAGNQAFGPAASLAGRNLGQDFAGLDGWSMYHGQVVPGFPRHPHRGFETVTIARQGFIDHSDSMGATARFGHGDVQWMTAGRGVVHSEMFPLLARDAPNPTELFQIWLNLPRADKLVEPHFAMLWDHTIPRHHQRDDAGRSSQIAVYAGRFGDSVAPSPPPSSWAARADSDVAIWNLVMEPGATCALPPATAEARRVLYFFRGQTLAIGGEELRRGVSVEVRANQPVTLVNGPEEAELLLLQGRPIGEPVVQHGPFVMNTASEIQQAFVDFRQSEFGGWPWDSDGPVHGAEPKRFARHADGRVEVADAE